MELRLGWKAGTEQYPPDELLRYAIAAEEAGFDSVGVSDHFQPWSEGGPACFAWSLLGAIAAKTTKIRLGTGVTCPILRYHPSIIAQAAATISSLAPGRFFLGVGTGEALNEYSACGKWPGYKARQSQLAEAIELIRQLFSGEKVTFRGDTYETQKAKLYTPPNGQIPIYISSLSPGSAAFAAKHGDGLISVGGEDTSVYMEIFANFKSGADHAAKNAAKMPRQVEVAVAFTGDKELAVEERKKFWAATFVPALFTQKIYTPQMAEENGKVVGSDAVSKAVCISENPEDHVNYAQQYVDLGFNEIMFHSAGPDQERFIKEYGEQVLPELRRRQETGRHATSGHAVLG